MANTVLTKLTKPFSSGNENVQENDPLATKSDVASIISSKLSGISEIDTPSSATAETIATKVNDILQALK